MSAEFDVEIRYDPNRLSVADLLRILRICVAGSNFSPQELDWDETGIRLQWPLSSEELEDLGRKLSDMRVPGLGVVATLNIDVEGGQ